MRNKAPGMVIKAFRDLETVFFNGAPGGNVVVCMSLISGLVLSELDAVCVRASNTCSWLMMKFYQG